MKRATNSLSVFIFLALALVGLAGETYGQRRNEREVRDIVRSINSRIADLEYALEDKYRYDPPAGGDSLMADIRTLKDAVDQFDRNFIARRENRDDIDEIVRASETVNGSLLRSAPERRIQDSWTKVREQVDRLSASYSASSAARSGGRWPGAPVPSRLSVGQLTGTYRLDTARSENTADIIAGTSVGGADRQDLESKLEAPEELALDVRGNQVTLASSKAAPVTIIADGREKQESDNGRTVRLRATLNGDVLNVSSLGGETDYTITFSPLDAGRSLKVSRRITTPYLSETIFAESYYTRSDTVARLGIDRGDTGGGAYSSSDPNDRPGAAPTIDQGRTGEFIVPSGTIITGILQNEIDTKVSQNNDRFKLLVQSPDQFRGATIEGYLSGVGRSGQISGRSNITFNFERITLRSGESYDFAGYLQSVKDQNGKVVKVDTEGTARGDSQGRETAKRGGAGAGIGALIGAIAGGVKGAAIGAVIGGGVGAGSVVVQGRDDLRLGNGSVMTIQASSPSRRQD
jgi:hypothetical protein